MFMPQTMLSPEAVIMAANPFLIFDPRYVAGADGAAITSCTGRTGRVWQQADGTKQPLLKHMAGRDTLRFDGVNDCLQTALAVALGATQALTIVAVTSQGAAGAGIALESSDGAHLHTDAWTVTRGDGVSHNFTGYFLGDVGAQYKIGTLDQGTGLVSHVHVYDKTAPGGTELRIYSNGSEITYGAFASPDNTNTFGDYVWNLGARNNGAAAALQGDVAFIAVYARVLSASDRNAVEAAVRQLVGL